MKPQKKVIFVANPPTKFENVTLEKAAPVIAGAAPPPRAMKYWHQKVLTVVQLKTWGAKFSVKRKTETYASSIHE